jgi:cytochrome c oxidase assembly factor CtaG
VRVELSDDPGTPNPPRWRAVVHPASAGLAAGLASTGLALIVMAILPPVETLARRYLFVGSIQFCLLSMAGPVLIVLGAPWRVLRLSRGRAEEPAGRPHQAGAPLGFADRLAAGRRRRPSFVRAAGFLAWWVSVCLCWRLPPVLDALARYPVLSLAELATLVPAGVGLWLELVNSPPLAPRLTRPPRAAIAALAMWSIWVIAYVLGFAGRAVVHAYDGLGSSLSTVADQEITVFVLWLAAACCFVPVIFASLLTWLRDGADPGEEPASSGVRGWGRQPRRASAGQARR